MHSLKKICKILYRSQSQVSSTSAYIVISMSVWFLHLSIIFE